MRASSNGIESRWCSFSARRRPRLRPSRSPPAASSMLRERAPTASIHARSSLRPLLSIVSTSLFRVLETAESDHRFGGIGNERRRDDLGRSRHACPTWRSGCQHLHGRVVIAQRHFKEAQIRHGPLREPVRTTPLTRRKLRLRYRVEPGRLGRRRRRPSTGPSTR